MPEIEERILAWRKKMMAALPASPRHVDEFEDHLRESIAELLRKGVPVGEAFSQASIRVGDPQAIAFQYRHIRTKRQFRMKVFGMVATAIIGPYLILMSLRFGAVCVQLVKNRLSPYSADAPNAFFPNLIVCTLSAMALWLIWRKHGPLNHGVSP